MALAAVLAASTVVGTACKSGRQNEAEGKATETKGKIESAIGDVTGNDNKQAEGRADQAKGGVQKDVGKAQQKVDSAVKKVTP